MKKLTILCFALLALSLEGHAQGVGGCPCTVIKATIKASEIKIVSAIHKAEVAITNHTTLELLALEASISAKLDELISTNTVGFEQVVAALELSLEGLSEIDRERENERLVRDETRSRAVTGVGCSAVSAGRALGSASRNRAPADDAVKARRGFALAVDGSGSAAALASYLIQKDIYPSGASVALEEMPSPLVERYGTEDGELAGLTSQLLVDPIPRLGVAPGGSDEEFIGHQAYLARVKTRHAIVDYLLGYRAAKPELTEQFQELRPEATVLPPSEMEFLRALYDNKVESLEYAQSIQKMGTSQLLREFVRSNNHLASLEARQLEVLLNILAALVVREEERN